MVACIYVVSLQLSTFATSKSSANGRIVRCFAFTPSLTSLPCSNSCFSSTYMSSRLRSRQQVATRERAMPLRQAGKPQRRSSRDTLRVGTSLHDHSSPIRVQRHHKAKKIGHIVAMIDSIGERRNRTHESSDRVTQRRWGALDCRESTAGALRAFQETATRREVGRDSREEGKKFLDFG